MQVTMSNVFTNYSKEYQSRPVKAAKYHRGMENGFMVYISGVYDGKRHDAMKFFNTENEANSYINANPAQYLMVDGNLIQVASIEYGEPQPVIHTKIAEGKQSEYIYPLENALESDESRLYEWFDLLDDSWIIVDDDGNVRVWQAHDEDDFFGKNYICEKIDNNYIEVAV